MPKAVVAVDVYGQCADYEAIDDICRKYGVTLIEDAAEALGASHHTKAAGSFGKAACFSFNGNKIVTSGGGGVIVTNNIELGIKAKFLTTTAKKPHSYEYVHEELGYNFRMPNLNAALACAQLEQLSSFLSNKRSLAKDYESFFKAKGIKFRTETENTRANYWLMCVELNDMKEREHFLKSTNNSGVMTRPIWKLMYRLPMYKDYQKDSQKNAQFLEERIVNIPSSVR